jgi:predicted RNase H-like HicB family nuclease
MKYVAVLERGETGWGAYVPDLHGCVAVAPTRDIVEKMIREAIPLHIQSPRDNGESVPLPASVVVTIDLAEASS